MPTGTLLEGSGSTCAGGDGNWSKKSPEKVVAGLSEETTDKWLVAEIVLLKMGERGGRGARVRSQWNEILSFPYPSPQNPSIFC